MAQRTRRHADGSYWIARGDRRLEAVLDKEHVRVPGSLRWFPRGYNKTLEEYKNKHAGTTAYLIGKGPSLDHLSAEDFKDADIVICVNDSIKQINKLQIKQPVYVVQQDTSLKESCVPRDPKTVLIISNQSRGWYADYLNRVIVTASALGVHDAGPTAVLSTHIASLLGCTKVTYVAFDAATNQNCEYAGVIGNSSQRGGDPRRFLSHREKMMSAITKLGLTCTWFTPEVKQIAKDADTPQQSSMRPLAPDGFSLSALSADLQDTED